MLLCSWLLSTADQDPALWKPKLIGVVEVGYVFQDCAHVTIAGRPAEIPIGFLITPNSAFQLAQGKVKFRCPSEFGNHLFADNDFYYITVGPLDLFLEKTKQNITPTSLRAISIRVHGLTGRVFPPENLN